jgi:aspartate aminotransferase
LAIVPGGAFGDDRCVRLSCAVSRETISEGLSRFQTLLTSS